MTWVFLLFTLVVAYLGFRFIRVLEAGFHIVEAVVNAKHGRKPFNLGQLSEDTGLASFRVVAEVPPEVIAPNIKRPPKSRGGFGTTVRSDDNTPLQQTDQSETGSEGGSRPPHKTTTDPS